MVLLCKFVFSNISSLIIFGKNMQNKNSLADKMLYTINCLVAVWIIVALCCKYAQKFLSHIFH